MLGGVKQGTGISIAADGTLSSTNSGATGTVTSVDSVAPVAGNVTLNAVTGSSAGTPALLTLWAGTKAQYDAIPVKSPTTVYVVTGAVLVSKETITSLIADIEAIDNLGMTATEEPPL